MLFESIMGMVGDGTSVVRECRRCGASVDGDAETCPHCGPGPEIVEYRLD